MAIVRDATVQIRSEILILITRNLCFLIVVFQLFRFRSLGRIESKHITLVSIWKKLKLAINQLNLFELVQAQKSIYRAFLDSFWILFKHTRQPSTKSREFQTSLLGDLDTNTTFQLINFLTYKYIISTYQFSYLQILQTFQLSSGIKNDWTKSLSDVEA